MVGLLFNGGKKITGTYKNLIQPCINSFFSKTLLTDGLIRRPAGPARLAHDPNDSTHLARLSYGSKISDLNPLFSSGQPTNFGLN